MRVVRTPGFARDGLTGNELYGCIDGIVYTPGPPPRQPAPPRAVPAPPTVVVIVGTNISISSKERNDA